MSQAPQEPFFSQLVWDQTDQEDVQHAILPCLVDTSCLGWPSPSGLAQIGEAAAPAKNVRMGTKDGDTDQSLDGEVPGSQYSLPFFLIKTLCRWCSANRLVVLCQLVLVKLGELVLHYPAERCWKASWLEA